MDQLTKHLRDLCAHGEWADARLLAAVRSAATPVPDALRELAHARGAQEVWLSRIEGRAARLAVWPTLSVDELDHASQSIGTALQQFCDLLSVDALTREVAYANTSSSGTAKAGGLNENARDLHRHARFRRCHIGLAESTSHYCFVLVSAFTRHSMNLSIRRPCTRRMGTTLRKCRFSRPSRFQRVLTLVAALFAVSVCTGVPAAAQGAPFVLKLDVNAGFGRTFGGGNRDVPAAVAFGAVLATPLRVQTHGVLVGGVALNYHWPLDNSTECTVLVSNPQQGCIPHYPKFTSVAALVGWEFMRHPKMSGARFLVGPATFRAEKKTTLGMQGRLDFTVMPTAHAGLVFWGQGAMTSPFQQNQFSMVTAGLGVRIQ